jgi:hypothetical protein
VKRSKGTFETYCVLKGSEKMELKKLKIGDIVRFKDINKKGLYEVTGTYEDKVYQVTVTNNECDSEYYANINYLIFVCAVENRQDI